MKFTDHIDQVIDGVSQDIEVAVPDVSKGDVLDTGADISEVSGNVWGDTRGAVWGHAPDRRTERGEKAGSAKWGIT